MKNNKNKKRQRIVMILQSVPGDSPFLLNKFLGLLKQSHDIHLICLEKSKNASGFLPPIQNPEIQKRIHIAWPATSRAAAVFIFPLVAVRVFLKNFSGAFHYFSHGLKLFGIHILHHFYLDAEMICSRPDILHFEFGSLAADRMHLAELLDCKIVVSFRGYDINYVGLDKKNYYGEVWEKSDTLHFLGEDLWRRALGRGCPSEKPHFFIPPAIDISFFHSKDRGELKILGTRECPLRLLSVGRLVWKKGYEFAIEAVRILKDRGIYFVYDIVGDGDYLESIAFARHQFNLEEKVNFLGEKSPAEVKGCMQRADIFLHSATSEGFCNAVLEAQAMQLPVVTSDADGLRENVLHEKTGFVVPRRNAQALANALMQLAHDPGLRRKMGAQGRKRVEENFQLADQISAFEKMYMSVITRRL